MSARAMAGVHPSRSRWGILAGALFVIGVLTAASYVATFRQGSSVIEPRRLVLEVVDIERAPIVGAEVTVLHEGRPADRDDVVTVQRATTDSEGRAVLVVSEPLRFGGWRWRLWWLIEVSDWPQPWRVRIQGPRMASESGLHEILRAADREHEPGRTVGPAMVRLVVP